MDHQNSSSQGVYGWKLAAGMFAGSLTFAGLASVTTAAADAPAEEAPKVRNTDLQRRSG